MPVSTARRPPSRRLAPTDGRAARTTAKITLAREMRPIPSIAEMGEIVEIPHLFFGRSDDLLMLGQKVPKRCRPAFDDPDTDEIWETTAPFSQFVGTM